MEYRIYPTALEDKSVVTITELLFQMLPRETDCEFELNLCDSHMLFVKAQAFTRDCSSRSPNFVGQSLEFHISTLDIHVVYRFGEKAENT